MIHGLHQLVWGPALIGLLLAAGGYYTWKSGFFQLRGAGLWWRATAGSLAGRSEENGRPAETGPRHAQTQETDTSLTKFQTACTALAATVGTGNIAGVATAITAGGPGAVFWMWVSALLGMMTAYAEVSLGIRFRRRKPDGTWFGGPCAYLSEGLHRPRLALLYGILCLCASLGMGSMVQSNAVSQTLAVSMGVPPLAAAVIVTSLVLGIVAGGAKRIAKVTVWLIPVAAAVYVGGAAVILAVCFRQIPHVLAEIVRCALLPEAVFGGVGGYGIRQAFRYGVARGVFSNEAGLGTLAGLHGSVEDTTPREQGMWAMFEVFFDTIVICTVTALVILCAQGAGMTPAPGGLEGAALAGASFGQILGPAGAYLVLGAMAVFAFSTMIAWYYLGRQTLGAVMELAGRLRRGRLSFAGDAAGYLAGSLYLLLFVYAVFLGCVCSLNAVWELSDIFNGLMAFPNLVALFLLRREVPLMRGRR